MRSSTTSRDRAVRRPITAALLAVVAATCFSAPAQAIDPERAMSQYIRDRWEGDRGFPGGAVHAITQTADGYLWIAADKGLVRFDGLTFRLFQPPGLTAGADSAVLGLAPDADGTLWAQLRSASLVRYRNDAFEDVPVEGSRVDTVVTAMARGNGGTILIAALDRGVMAWRAGALETVVAQGLMPRSFVIAIAQTADGDIWLGTRDSGVLRVRGGRVTFITKGLPDQKVNTLLPGDHHDVWIGTDGGVVRWDGAEVIASGLPGSLEHVGALGLARDRESNVWIAAGADGFLRANRHGVSALDPGDGSRRRTVTAVFEDRDRNLWIGTTRGIERLRDGVFTSYTASEGLPSGGYGPVYVDEERTWFAPADGGLYALKQGSIARITQAGLGADVVYSITGGDGDIWVARQRGGLTRLRVRGDTIAARRFTQADGLAQNNVYAVQRSRDGAVWAGTLSGGVSRFKDGAFTTYTTASGLASNTVTSILESTDGAMWFATPSGVSVRSAGGWHRYAISDGLPSNDINTLFEDSARRLWIGTGEGLALLRGGNVQPLKTPPQLRAAIVGIAEDRAGWLWISTPDRVVRVNRERLLDGTLTAEGMREYSAADGLPGVEGVKRHRSLVTDWRGRIWLSTGGGLAMADPASLDRRAAPALVRVEDVSGDGSSLDRRGRIVVPPGQQRLTLSYTGLSLAVPERVMFRYRLDGFDREWSAPLSARQAVYTNLAPGPYRFRVVASNSDGLWNGPETDLPFEVRPTFRQSAWFQLSLVLVCAAAGWGVYRVRVMQMARQLNVRFEERLAERTLIAQELHDTLLQGFVSASMQLHVATDRLPADSPAKASLGHVTDLMARVIEEGRNAVRGLRSPGSGSDDLEQAFSLLPRQLATGAQIEYRVIVDGTAKRLNPGIRDEVYRIGREAVVNAFRHSQAGTIELELQYAPRNLRMVVRDNGRGIDPGVLRSGSEGHWGLSGMRERAERVGARLQVWSRATAGTEIELVVPSQVAFRPEPADRQRGWLRRRHRSAAPSRRGRDEEKDR